MDTGVKTAVLTGFDMERTGVASEKERIALQAQMVAHLTQTLVEFYCPSSKPLLLVVIPPVTLVEARTFLQVGLIGFSAQLAEMRFLLMTQLMKFTHVVAHFMLAFVAL